MNLRWTTIGLLLLLSAIARAETVVSLPLDGYYRPGRYFPVKVESDRDVTIEVVADGISSRGRGRDLVLPAMSVSRVPGVVKVTVDGKTSEWAIRPLEAGQPLPVQVPPAAAGWPAYESAFDPPDRGPVSSLDSAAAYRAASALIAERPAGTRRTVWLATALFALLAIAASLARWRYTAAAVGGLAVLWTVGAGIVYARSPAITERVGWVILRQGEKDLARHQWVFRTASHPIEDSFIAATGTMVRPLLAANSDLKIWIEPADGGWRYRYTLTPGAKAVFVVYGAEGGLRNEVPVVRTQVPVMMDIARRYYQRPGDRLVTLPAFEEPPVRAEVVRVEIAH